jgi:DNA-binding Lrp family transcriptional regulator
MLKLLLTIFTKIPYQFTATPMHLVDKIPTTVTAAGLRMLLAITDRFKYREMSTTIVDNSDLMSRTGLSAKGVQRGRKQLVEAGIIEAEQVGSNQRSPRWRYRFPAEVLGLDQLPEPKQKSAPKQKSLLDKDVQSKDKDVQPLDKDVHEGLSGKERADAYWGKVSEASAKPEKTDIRNIEYISLYNGFEEQKPSETDSPKPTAKASVLAVGDKSVELAKKMIELAKTKLADGDLDLNDWKPLALEAISPNTEGAKLLLVSYNQELLKDEYFKRVVKELR